MADEARPAPGIDPEKLQKSLIQIAELSADVTSKFLERQPQVEMLRDMEELGITQAFMELGTRFLTDPAKLAEFQMRAWDDYMKLWNSVLQRVQGAPADPVKEPQRGDNRFRGELWENNFVFDYVKQSYLIAADHIQRAVAETQGLDKQTARKVKFFTRQYVDALAPSNFALTNPEVLKATVETGGQNLLNGLNNLLKDLERGHGKLAISMTDYDAFELGKNVATTPGKVVFQNDLMQLLQYEPTTPQVDRTPLLITPPWINKYYILDLRAKNSFIKWAVDRGLTVYVISWVNPDGRLAHKTFDDYLLEGPLAAMDAIRDATGESAVNLIGYCLGGTLTACLMSWLRARGQAKRVKSVTYFTTMIDFAEPGELGVFVDEQTVASLEKRMATRGYLEGDEMAGTFNLLRDNDLIWSFVVNNYLLGKEPFPFDLLYWNSDSTRMPARMHTFYLRNMYIRNLLSKPGAVSVAGEPMELKKVTTPTYFISTMEDHIAPWKSTYAGARLFTGPVRFVLGGSGHIAGIVNPPAAQKYSYWTNEQMPDSADQWLASAARHEGSWWSDWGAWIAGFGGGKVAARTPGDGGLRVIEDAPGSYAKLRLDKAASQDAPSAAPDAPARESNTSSVDMLTAISEQVAPVPENPPASTGTRSTARKAARTRTVDEAAAKSRPATGSRTTAKPRKTTRKGGGGKSDGAGATSRERVIAPTGSPSSANAISALFRQQGKTAQPAEGTRSTGVSASRKARGTGKNPRK